MKRGKKITLFLIDGEPGGRIMAELSNWTGKAYKIPRELIRTSDDRKELHTAGIYILLGRDDIENLPVVYIGETERVLDRIKQHNDKDFWNEAIIFISKDENLNRAHVQYMERKLYDIAKDVSRSILKNESRPRGAHISEPDKAEMDEFIDNIIMLTGVLGYKIFERIDTTAKTVFYLVKPKKNIEAKGILSNEGFIVLKGSKLSEEIQPSCSESHIETREMLVNWGIIDTSKWTFIKDYEFTSPSKAASVVLGRNANGLTEWKTKDGQTLKEYLDFS